MDQYAIMIAGWLAATVIFMVLYFAYGVSPLAILRVAFGGPIPHFRRRARSSAQHTEAEVSAARSVSPQMLAENDPHALSLLPIEERGHIIIAGRQGDGKTQTSIMLLISDIARSAQVYWLNPHATLFHPKDQRTDLRPLVPYFTLVRDYASIVATLKASYTLVREVRLPLYWEGKDVGPPIVLYLDEWPAIVDATDDEATRYVKLLLRESRKCNVWLVLATQDAQVDTLKLKSGVRAAFNTRLIGNVDDATWLALAGKGVPRPALSWGQWWLARSSGSQLLAWRPFPSSLVSDLAGRLAPPTYPPLGEVSNIFSTTVQQPDAERLLAPWQHSLSEPVPSPLEEGRSGDFTTTSNQFARTGTNAVTDTGAVQASTMIAEDVLIAELVRRGKSANFIYEAIGGTRATVLEKVRKLRENG